MAKGLEGKVAVVTGASRGIGKGIAVELGAAGATVYVTGRTVKPGGLLAGTIGETVAEIEALGGRGVAVQCDHHDDAAVASVFDRVKSEQGRLDVLVNNVYPAPQLAAWLGQPFWELPLEAWDEVIDIGLRSHYVASVYAAPMLLEGAPGTMIVNISSSGAIQHAHNVSYGVGKAALDKMTADMAHELRAHGVAVVSVWPGLVRTELVMLGAQQQEDGRSTIDLPGEGAFDLGDAESPRFVGRGVVALASDPGVMTRTGKAFPVSELAAVYGFTDIDGRVPKVLIRPND